jgi:formate dehydrogenase major subunit
MLQVTINGRAHELPEGITILQACEKLSIEIPNLCHDPRIKPVGACRLCVVQVGGEPRPVTACNTLLRTGMVIETHTPEIDQSRRTNLQLLARSYPVGAADTYSGRSFHQYLRAYGVENSGLPQPEAVDASHPYIQFDSARCIYCYRCARICEELQGQFVWRIWNRADRTRILPDSQTTLLESSCVSCGGCVDSCPSGALEDKTILALGAPDHWTRTTCPYCGVGCEMLAGTRAGRLVQIKPALDSPVNKGHLCVKGRYAFEFVYAKDRVTEPMICENGAWKTVSWEDAIAFAAAGLRRVVEKHGADSVGVLGSARATNEENYLAQKFARLVLGTHNVDCCARVCHGPTAAAMKRMLGTGAATNSFDDIEQAQTILVCGSNATENHPIVGARIKQARLRGANLLVIDPRRIELAQYANIHLQLRPGTNIPLFNALACAIVEEKLYDETAVRERVAEWDEFQEFISAWPPEKVAGVCGVEAGAIRAAARLYATARPAMCLHGLGMTEHSQGTDGVMALVNLALLTGNFGKPGSGINPLRGQNNVQGSAHMGCEPNNLTGFVSPSQGRELFEKIWKAPLPLNPGLNLVQMLDAASAGTFKALWAIGYDVALSHPNAHATRKALSALDFVIVQDLFRNEMTQFASVFLPVASSFEKEGTFMSSERRVQRVRKAIEPIGNSRPDWVVIRDVARAMGRGEAFDFQSPEEIWEEVRAVWKVGSGISYRRLDQGGLQWPCPSEDHPGTAVLHGKSFPTGPQAGLARIEFSATSEQPSPEFPFVLITGRTLYQFNAGTMTLRTSNLQLRPADLLDVAEADALDLALRKGQKVRVRSRYGHADLPVRINPAMRRGELFASFATGETFLNQVTSPHRDRVTGTPEYKVTAVCLEV